MNNLKKVIELIRVSTEQQAASDRASIPAQRAVNARTCSQYDLEIVRTIEVTDVSGACVTTAPEIQELVRLMQAPEIHGVVTREFSRLMRPENFGDYALLQSFVDSKTVLYLPEGPIDLTSKSGRLMGAIRAAMAGMDRTEILERVWSAKEVKRKRGNWPRARLCWGSELVTKRVVASITSPRPNGCVKPSACSWPVTRTTRDLHGSSASPPGACTLSYEIQFGRAGV